MPRIHPITLSFSDKKLENEVRSSWKSAALILGLNEVLIILATTAAGYGPTGFQVFSYTVGTALMLLLRGQNYMVASIFWTLCWVTNVCAWWIMLWRGDISRIDPIELDRTTACGALWVLVGVGQHVMHVEFTQRLVVISCALTIILSGKVWRALLSALVIGEAAGYALERMLRECFLWHADTVEQLRCEKERVAFDLALVQHEARLCGRRQPSESSYGTDSEVIAFVATGRSAPRSSGGKMPQ